MVIGLIEGLRHWYDTFETPENKHFKELYIVAATEGQEYRKRAEVAEQTVRNLQITLQNIKEEIGSTVIGT